MPSLEDHRNILIVSHYGGLPLEAYLSRRPTKDRLKNQIVESINYAYAEGIDSREIREWKWPS